MEIGEGNRKANLAQAHDQPAGRPSKPRPSSPPWPVTTSPPSRPLPLELEAQPVTPSSWPTQAAGPAWPAAEAAPTPSPSGSRRSQQPPPHHKGKPGAASAPAPSPAPSRRPCCLMHAACPFSARKPRIAVHSAWSPSRRAKSTPDAARSRASPL